MLIVMGPTDQRCKATIAVVFFCVRYVKRISMQTNSSRERSAAAQWNRVAVGGTLYFQSRPSYLLAEARNC
jgi:hypothetical protein